jgi:CheY-like chemotaxis protein
MNNGMGMATESPLLAEILRDLLPVKGRVVRVYSGELELLTQAAKQAPRIIFMENSFDGFGTEDFIYRLTKRYRSLRIAVWATGLVGLPRRRGSSPPGRTVL